MFTRQQLCCGKVTKGYTYHPTAFINSQTKPHTIGINWKPAHILPPTLCPDKMQLIHLWFVDELKESGVQGWHFALAEAPSEGVKGQIIE